MADKEENKTESMEDIIEKLNSTVGGALVGHIKSSWMSSKDNRQEWEIRCLKAWLNFRARYGEDISFLDTEKSRVFIKITKTKTLASYGQLIDVFLGGPRFPIAVEPTEKPIGVPEQVHLNPADLAPQETPDVDPIGFAGDGNDLKPDESFMDRTARMISEKLKLGKGGEEAVKEGPATAAGQVTISPAKMAAEAMTTKIQDQLTESNMTHEFRKFLFEVVLLGTGCLKGPFYSEKEYPMWGEGGEYTPIKKVVPISKQVSVWNLYPDPNAYSMEDAEWVIERHRMSRKEVWDLRKQPNVSEERLKDAIEAGANYEDQYWEQNLREGNDKQTTERFEVLEYWGKVDSKLLDGLGLDLDDGTDQVSINAFVCNGEVIRAVINPFKPSRIPYYVAPYEEDPYNFFGVGLPENMEDSQTLCNGFARMAVDNAVLAGNVMLEVDTDALVPGTPLDVYAGKVWPVQSGTVGQAVRAMTFPSTGNQNLAMYDKFRQLADESTGISSFSHGQTGISGIGRTASGISMLMNAASTATKTVIKNIDDYALEPLGKAYFAFNMQFDYDPSIAGDLEVKPLGVSSLMQKEVKSQRLLQFMQVTAGDPNLRARVNEEYLLKELAGSLELDAKEVTLSPEEAAVKAALMAQANPEGQAPAGPQAAGLSPQDQTGGGGGMMGVGAAPGPMDPQFTGNEGGNPNEPIA